MKKLIFLAALCASFGVSAQCYDQGQFQTCYDMLTGKYVHIPKQAVEKPAYKTNPFGAISEALRQDNARKKQQRQYEELKRILEARK